MTKQSPTTKWRSTCPVSCALDVIGDKWSLLIIRDLVLAGPCTYTDFLAAPEGISTNILASRLTSLTALGLIERVNPDGAARNNAYRLTASGEAMRPVVLALGEWAQQWLTELDSETPAR